MSKPTDRIVILRNSIAHHDACELTLVFMERAREEHNTAKLARLAIAWAAEMANRLPALKANVKTVQGAAPFCDVDQWTRAVAILAPLVSGRDRDAFSPVCAAIRTLSYFTPEEAVYFRPQAAKLFAQLKQEGFKARLEARPVRPSEWRASED